MAENLQDCLWQRGFTREIRTLWPYLGNKSVIKPLLGPIVRNSPIGQTLATLEG